MNPHTTHQQDPYVSRVGDSWKMVERQDPVVWGEAKGPLSSEQLANFARNGFLAIPSLFSSDEVEMWRQEGRALADDPGRANIPPEEVITEPDNARVRSIFRVHQNSPVFSRLARDPRLLHAAQQILNSDVYIHQSRINFKPGFDGREFYWHSDFETWHVEDGMPRMRALSVSVLMTQNNEFNGPLMLIPGSHRLFISCEGKTPEAHHLQSLKKQEFGVPTHEALRQLVEKGGMAAPLGPAGSVVFFDCNTMHGSAGNLSPYPRNNVFMVYNSMENALVEPFGGMKPRPDFLAERNPVALRTEG